MNAITEKFDKLNIQIYGEACFVRVSLMFLQSFIHLPMKMEPIVSSETSAIRTQTPGNYPKRNKLLLNFISNICFRKFLIYETNMCTSDIHNNRRCLFTPACLGETPPSSGCLYTNV